MPVEIPVLLEPLPEGGFRTRSGDLFALASQGDTPEAALQNLRELVVARIASGVVLTALEVPASNLGPHPGAGMYRDESLFDRWRTAIEEYRQQIEDDPDIP
jgi:hypothetical protein